MATKTFVRVVESSSSDHRPPSLQEFDEEGNAVGPVFRPADSLSLVSKQVEIIRRAINDLKRVPGDTVALLSEPARLRPVIGLHMRAVDIVSPHLEEGVQLHNPRTGNMRFQSFTHSWVSEEIYVEIHQKDDGDERPILQPARQASGFPSYEIRVCSSQFEALLGQIEAAPRCLVTLDLVDPSGLYISSWREPAKLYGSGVPSRKADGTIYDETIPHFGIARFMDLQVSTFPNIQPIETVYLRRRRSDEIDARPADTSETEARIDEVAPGGREAVALTAQGPASLRGVKLLLCFIVLLLILILLRL